jgi:Fusaric acid resistance protein-like
MSAIGTWLREHDPGYGALRRAARTALIMPAMFALGDKVIANPVLATFAAFGSFAMLLLVDFTGPMTSRLLDQAGLAVGCAVLISLATLVSRTTWLSAATMAVVAFVVLFSGAVSSVLVGANTSLLLSFILPVSLPGSASSIPDRVAGWGLAAAASLLAISLLWPSPSRDPVRNAAIAACRALADRLRAGVAYVMAGGGAELEEAYHAAVARADQAVGTMERLFFATPYRPTGLSTDARAGVRLVDELRWLSEIVLSTTPMPRPRKHTPRVGAVKRTAADVLDRAADLLESPRGSPDALRSALDRMQGELGELERATTTSLPPESKPPEDPEMAKRVISSLDPSFRAQELSFVVAQIATNTDFAAAAARRPWLQQVLGHQPAGIQGTLSAAQERAGSHVARDSLWLQNSLRGAVALGLAVLVSDLSSVQHGFWVAFGTLAVLRSNALSTGQNLVRALVGTTAGFVIGGFLVYLVGTNTDVLWGLLPVAILFAGLAPSAISFVAGQAAFTLTLLILFNIIAPAGWRIGLVRVEDVALGGVVSLAVGILFWPRGATAALGRALAQAYRDTANYLAAAVAYGVECCDPLGPRSSAPRREAVEAAAASRRLDAAFRGYLAERGSKPARLADVAELVTGVTGVRLAGDAVLDLWDGGGAATGDRSAARRELSGAAGAMTSWYGHFASSLTGSEPVPDPLAPDQVADGRLVDAVAHDLSGSDGHATATGIRVIWTGDHLDAVRRLQATLVPPAKATVADGGPSSP